MKIIPENLIAEIEATSEDAGFPATNLLEKHSRQTYAAASGVTSTQLNVNSIGSASNTLFLWYMLGATATITIYDGENLTGSVIYGPTAHTLLVSDDYYAYAVQIPGLWVEYTTPGTAHSAKIVLARTGDEPEAGIVWAGKRWEIGANPQWGMGRPEEDHSIAYDLGNGYEYLYARNRQKIWPMSLILRGNPPTKLFTFMEMMAQIGPWPVPVLTVDNGSPAYRYLNYARFLNVQPTEAKYNHSTVNFTLKEYL